MYLHLPKLPKFLTAAAGSAFVTTGLVFLMVQLITIDDDGFVEAPPPVSIDYYEVREDLPVDPTPPKVEPPPVVEVCLLYTSPSPRDQRGSRMPSSA